MRTLAITNNRSTRSSSAKPRSKRGRGVGGNIINDIAEKFLDVRYMRNTQKALYEYGNIPIQDCYISRAIIRPKFLNYINKLIRVVPYDDLYHLKLIIILEDGTKLQLEKVPHIALRPYTHTPGEEHLHADLQGKTLYQLMFKTGEYMGDGFFTYNAFHQNCQDFVLAVLAANSTVTPEMKNFIFQEFDLKQINKKWIVGAKTITDLKKIFDAVFTGGNARKRIR